jgi:hypothetical protein
MKNAVGGLDELYKVLNRKVIADFEHKPITQI